MEGRFYWLKLKRDFFKRHDIRIIESQENGKDYVLFYLKLLLESVDHEGNLRFSDEIPYNEEMLATITNTNIDVVRSAVNIFLKLGMMQLLDDGTYYMSEVEKLIASAADNGNANRQRRFQERKREQMKLETASTAKNNADITPCVIKNNESIDIDIEKEKDIRDKNTYVRLDGNFETLWEKYPKKRGKQSALKAYLKACKMGDTYGEIATGIDNYVRYIKATKTPMQYVKNGSTFFNQRAWLDDWSIDTSRLTTKDLAEAMDFSDMEV